MVKHENFRLIGFCGINPHVDDRERSGQMIEEVSMLVSVDRISQHFYQDK
jgi:hypothetical protein